MLSFLQSLTSPQDLWFTLETDCKVGKCVNPWKENIRQKKQFHVFINPEHSKHYLQKAKHAGYSERFFDGPAWYEKIAGPVGKHTKQNTLYLQFVPLQQLGNTQYHLIGGKLITEEQIKRLLPPKGEHPELIYTRVKLENVQKVEGWIAEGVYMVLTQSESVLFVGGY